MHAPTLRQSLSQADGQVSESGQGFWAWLAQKLDFTQTRPQAAHGVIASQLTGREGSYYILKNPEAITYFRLSAKDYFLWQRMDGQHTVKELVLAFFIEYKVLAFGRVSSLIDGLKSKSFLEEKPVILYQDLRARLDRRNPQSKMAGLGRMFIERQFAIRGLDKPLTSFYRHFGRVFYTLPAQVLWVGVTLAGLVCFSQVLTTSPYSMLSVGGSVLWGAISLFVAFQCSTFVHELAHGLTVKHYGREVSRGGFMIYYGLPAFFVDTNDIWMEGKRARLAVSWAGPYADLILAGLASLALFLFPQFPLNPLLFQFVSITYLAVLFNLNPLLELDGYFLLMDSLEIPMLRRRSLQFIRHDLWEKIKKQQVPGLKFWRWFKGFSREERIFTIFGMLAGIYSIFSIAEAIVIWQRRILSTVSPLYLQSGAAVRVALLIGAALLGLALLIGIGIVLVGYIRRLQVLAARAGLFATPWRKAAWVLALILVIGSLALIYPPLAPWIGLAALSLAVYFAICNAVGYSGSRFARVFWLMSGACLAFWLAEAGKLAVSWIGPETSILDGAADRLVGMALFVLVIAGLSLSASVSFRRLNRLEKYILASGLIASVVFISAFAVTLAGRGERLETVTLAVLKLLPLFALCLLFPTLLSFWHTSTGPAAAITGLGLVALLGSGLAGVPPVWAYLCLAGGFGLQQAAYRRRVTLHTAQAEIDQAQSDHDFLKLAFHATMLGLEEQIFESGGGRQAAINEERFNPYAQAAGWQIQVHRNQVKDGLPADASLRELGDTYAAALNLFLDLMVAYMGEKMAARALQRVYDLLPWETREIASQYLFPEVKRCQALIQQFQATQQTYYALLRRNLLFATLSEDAIDYLCSRLHVERYKPGQVIIRQGDGGDKFYIIANGSIEVSVRNAEGVSQIVNRLGRGDYFGEVALLEDKPRNATCRAVIPTEVLSLSRGDFDQLVKVCFELGQKLEGSISRANLLRHIPLFAGIDDQNLQLITSQISEGSFEAGEIVFRQGEAGEVFYVIEDGWVQVSVDQAGVQYVVAELGPGEYFGEMALLTKSPRNATVSVAAPTRLLALEKANFERLVVPQLYTSRVLEQEMSRRMLLTRRSIQNQLGYSSPSGGIT